MDLGLDVTHEGRWVVLGVRGEVDVATAPQLRECLVKLVADGEDHLVVDLSGVDFLDSTGLGVLIGALKRVRMNGGDLRLVCSQPRILKVFDITGLSQIFTVRPSVADAVSD